MRRSTHSSDRMNPESCSGFILFILSEVCLLPSAFATATTFYVDRQWLGTLSGTAAQPRSSTHGNSAAVSTALTTGPVIIFSTARPAGSDTNSVMSETHSTSVPDADGIDLSLK